MPHASAATEHQLRPPRSRRRAALPDPDHDPDHRDQLQEAEREEPQGELVGGDGDAGDDEPGDVAEDLHHAHERTSQPDLRPGNEVRDVALERTLGEVGRELQEGYEGGDGQQVLAERDAGQEHHIEHGADEDVRLAAAPAADRVVADRADRRLDEHRDDGATDRQQEQRPARHPRPGRAGRTRCGRRGSWSGRRRSRTGRASRWRSG